MSTPANPDPETHWKNRRRMAWLAWAWTVVQTPLWASIALIAPETVPALASVIGWSYGVSSLTLGAYYGGCAVEALKGGR